MKINIKELFRLQLLHFGLSKNFVDNFIDFHDLLFIFIIPLLGITSNVF